MISKEAKEKLKKSLPGGISKGYDALQEKLPELSRQQIEKAFNSDAHYNEEVILAAIKLVEESKEHASTLETRINAI